MTESINTADLLTAEAVKLLDRNDAFEHPRVAARVACRVWVGVAAGRVRVTLSWSSLRSSRRESAA